MIGCTVKNAEVQRVDLNQIQPNHFRSKSVDGLINVRGGDMGTKAVKQDKCFSQMLNGRLDLFDSVQFSPHPVRRSSLTANDHRQPPAS